MSRVQVTKFRWFWVWQDDKQEAWLEAMSCAGLHLKNIKAFGRYVFEVGEPQHYTYRMDFDQSSGKDSDYFHLIQEAGWEHLIELFGWQFWRKEAGEGRTAELFTDTDSKIRKYKRLRVSLSSPAPAIFVIVLAMFKRFPGRHPQWFVISTISIFVLYILFLVVNLVKISMRIRDLEQIQPL
jgi:hypothetical protein